MSTVKKSKLRKRYRQEIEYRRPTNNHQAPCTLISISPFSEKQLNNENCRITSCLKTGTIYSGGRVHKIIPNTLTEFVKKNAALSQNLLLYYNQNWYSGNLLPNTKNYQNKLLCILILIKIQKIQCNENIY